MKEYSIIVKENFIKYDQNSKYKLLGFVCLSKRIDIHFSNKLASVFFSKNNKVDSDFDNCDRLANDYVYFHFDEKKSFTHNVSSDRFIL